LGTEKGGYVELLRQQTALARFGELALRSDDLCHTTFNLKNLKRAISMTYRSTRYLINDTLLDNFGHLPTSYLRIVS
jgi:hypothetical protein